MYAMATQKPMMPHNASHPYQYLIAIASPVHTQVQKNVTLNAVRRNSRTSSLVHFHHQYVCDPRIRISFRKSG